MPVNGCTLNATRNFLHVLCVLVHLKALTQICCDSFHLSHVWFMSLESTLQWSFKSFHLKNWRCLQKKTLFNFQLLLVWRVKNIHGWSYIGFGLGMTMKVVTKQVLNIGWLENKFCDFFFTFFYTQTFIYSIQMGRTNQYSATCARHRFFTNNKFNKIFARLCTRIGACSTVYHISHIF